MKTTITLFIYLILNILCFSQADSVAVFVTTPPIYTFNQGTFFTTAHLLPYDPISANSSIIMSSNNIPTVQIEHYTDGSFSINNSLYANNAVMQFNDVNSSGDFMSHLYAVSNPSGTTGAPADIALDYFYNLRDLSGEVCVAGAYPNNIDTAYYYFKIKFTEYQNNSNFWNNSDSIPIYINNSIISAAYSVFYEPMSQNIDNIFSSNAPVLNVDRIDSTGEYIINGIPYSGSDLLDNNDYLTSPAYGEKNGRYYMSDSIHTTGSAIDNLNLDSIYNARNDGDSIYICFFYDNTFTIVSFYYLGFAFSDVYSIADSTGFVSNPNVTEFKVIQNPVIDVANIYTNQKTIYVYNNKGVVISSINTGNDDVEKYILIPIDVSSFESGMYFINDGNKSIRIIKTK